MPSRAGTPRTLDDLIRLSGVDGVVHGGSGAAQVLDVTHDSRRVSAGSLFCCVRGSVVDGHDFAVDAVRSGAAALLVEEPIPGVPADLPQVVVSDVRASIGPLASAFHGFPSRHLMVVGVTGTNGKTTTCHLIASVLRHAGLSVEVLGTLQGRFTTPEACDLQRDFARMVDNGVRAVVMEVSSHALALHRVDGTGFAATTFTNLSQDHLDFHGDMESYFAAKARLFTSDFTSVGVVNIDDAYGRRLTETAAIRMVPFSLKDVSDVSVTPTAIGYEWRGTRVAMRMGGSVNVANSLAAAATCRELGIDAETIAGGLSAAEPVRGRYEPVPIARDFVVLVDYAHTPDGLESLLGSLRDSLHHSGSSGRLIVVFGCGGDRDQAKRPLMGEIAARVADVVLVTSDNPRSEDPQSIVDDIVAGVPESHMSRVALRDVDRRRTIHAALDLARAGDVVVIAGKGHEVTQTVGLEVLPFDDRVIVREWEGRAA